MLGHVTVTLVTTNATVLLVETKKYPTRFSEDVTHRNQPVSDEKPTSLRL